MRFKVEARATLYYTAEVEAEDIHAAWDKAEKLSDFQFKLEDDGDLTVEEVYPLED